MSKDKTLEDTEPEKEIQQNQKSPKKGSASGKKKIIVRGIIILAALFLGANYFLNKKEPAPKQVVQKKQKQPVKNKPVANPQPPKKQAKKEPELEAGSKDQGGKEPPLLQEDSKPISEQKPQEQEKKEEKAQEDQGEEVKENKTQEDQAQEDQDGEDRENKAQESEAQEDQGEEAKEDKDQEEKNLNKNIESQDKKAQEKTLEPEVPGWVVFLETVEINPNVNYPPPKNYELKGKGLVYNCQARHWACADRSIYVQCAQHQKKLKEQAKNPSCIIRQVYFSPTHCARGQLMSIHKRIIPKECGL